MEPSLSHFRLAVKLAGMSKSKFRLGAVLTRKKHVISVGINKMKTTHPTQQKYSLDGTLMGLHAEVHACLGVNEEQFYKSELYVARIKKNGIVAMAKPCDDCHRFLTNVGVIKVHYSTDFNSIETIKL